MESLILLIMLLTGHFIFDYPLQGDWLAKAKNPTLTLIPGEKIWPSALFGHAVMHATAVMLVLLFWQKVPVNVALSFFCLELVTHSIIDYLKCKGYYGYNVDQYLHVGVKMLIWLFITIFYMCSFSGVLNIGLSAACITQ